MPSGAKPKIYPPELVERVASLYHGGKTQHEIAREVGISQKVIWNVMRRHGIKARVAAKRNQLGPANSSWRGDLAGYHAFHRRLYAKFGKPKSCSVCGSADTARSYDYANLTGRYQDIEDFAAMCRSCHWKYDDKIFNIRKMRRDAGDQAKSS